MKEYHKIQTIFKRDMDKPGKPLIEGEWTNDEFMYLANNEWLFTEKVDGTNIRVMVDQENGIRFGGRTDSASIPSQLYARLQDLFYRIVHRLKEMFPNGVCLYGEGYGAKIQKIGDKYKSNQDFVLFDIKVGDYFLDRSNVVDIANSIGIKYVPVIGSGNLYLAVEMAKKGFRSVWGDFEAEGLIATPLYQLRMKNGDRIIAKIKCRDFRSIA